MTQWLDKLRKKVGESMESLPASTCFVTLGRLTSVLGQEHPLAT